jgi:hypothetical protein
MSPAAVSPPFVVVVSGLPRSGTSMMMKMMEAGGLGVIADGLRAADIDNPNGYYEFEPAKKIKEDASWLNEATGKAVKMVYQLLYDLPTDRTYRVLFMRRAMPEILASQRKMLERLGRTNPVPDEDMARMFEKQLAKFFNWAAAQHHLTLMEVDYNRMIADPPTLIASINQFLGGGLDEAAMAAVVDPSLHRNRAS